jgi:uncharacterized membrane protein (DUF2068 family)
VRPQRRRIAAVEQGMLELRRELYGKTADDGAAKWSRGQEFQQGIWRGTEIGGTEKCGPLTSKANPDHSRWLVLIGVLKLFKAVLFILLGVGALQLLHKDLTDIVTHFILALRFDPENHFINLVLEKVALISPHRLREISVAIFLYAALDIIEGTGLALEKTWAEYLTLILTASFLPWEIFEIIRHITWLKVVLLVLNVAVVIFLIFHVQGRIRARAGQRSRPAGV